MAKRYHHSKKMKHHAGHSGHSMHDYEHGKSEHYGSPEANHKPQKYNDENHSDKDMRGSDMDFNNSIAQRANRNEFYAGMEPRRRQELEDAEMIHEDQRAIANLPQEVMIKPYPKTGPYLPEGLEDTIRGVDMQMDYDDEQRRNHFYPKKV